MYFCFASSFPRILKCSSLCHYSNVVCFFHTLEYRFICFILEYSINDIVCFFFFFLFLAASNLLLMFFSFLTKQNKKDGINSWWHRTEYIGPNTQCFVPIQFNPMQCNVRTSPSFLLFSHCHSSAHHPSSHTLCYTTIATVCTTGICSTAPVCSLLSNNRQVFLPELSLRSIITYNKLLLFGTHSLLTSSPRLLSTFAVSVSLLNELRFFYNVCYFRRKRTSVSVWALLPLLNNRLMIYFSLRFQCARRI